jgi:uncharacterized protein (UPF0335 family)
MPRKNITTTEPTIGHNSVDREKLRSLVNRISALEDEKIGIAEDIRGVYQEARLAGFDAVALRHVVRLRCQDSGERAERQRLVDEYMAALGDYATTPLGQAAMERAGLMPPLDGIKHMADEHQEDDRFERWLAVNGIHSAKLERLSDGKQRLRFLRKDGSEVLLSDSYPHDALLTPHTTVAGSC